MVRFSFFSTQWNIRDGGGLSRSGMVARSTDGHKTNASLGSVYLGGDGIMNFYSANNWQYFRILPKICIFADEKNSYGKNDTE